MIKTIGELKKAIANIDDDFTITAQIVRELSEEELSDSNYPYPYEYTKANLEIEDIGYSDKDVFINVEEISDDVCEWIKYDYRTICPKNHDANNPYWRIPDNMDKLKYCPYCGKKIKVANFNDKHIVGNSEDTLVNLIHKVMNGKYDDL